MISTMLILQGFRPLPQPICSAQEARFQRAFVFLGVEGHLLGA